MAFKSKDIDTWTTDDFMEFITSIGIKGNRFTSIKQCMEDDGLEASDVRGSAAAIKELFNIPSILAKKIKNKLDALLVAQSLDDNDPDDNVSNGFQINLRGKQGKFITLKRLFTKESYVRDVALAYKDEECINASYKLEKILLLSGAVVMDHNKKLNDYGIVSEMNRLSVIYKTKGGMAALASSSSSNARDRKIKYNKYSLIKTSLPDEIIGYNDDDGINRALLDCKKHALAANTMWQYITTSLASNLRQKHIFCPNQKCKKQLDWNKCTQIADMNFKEYNKWTEVIEKRALGNVKNCPHCNSYCTRDDGVAIFRMRCIACSGSDWCWECAQIWRGSGLSMCNNLNCTIIKETNEKLLLCKTVKVAHINANMPEFRACPRCLTFIQYSTACKHMICSGCDKHFCFVCLSLKGDNGVWPCGSHTDLCSVAPRQQFK